MTAAHAFDADLLRTLRTTQYIPVCGMVQLCNTGFCYAHVRAVTAVVQIAFAAELHLAVAWLTNSRIRHMTEHAH